MAGSVNFRYRNILRLLSVVAVIVYIAFLIGEMTSEFTGTTWERITTIGLFIVFTAGFYYLWKNELFAGLIWIVWYAFLLLLVRFVWIGAGITIVFGLPILVLGILVFLYGWKAKRKS